MIRNIAITALLYILFQPVSAQQKPLEREVTLYNPYKPSLNETRKKSYLPEITDTASFKPQFTYDVTATPFMPSYNISPVKAAVMQPDPLAKLYRSYVNIGFGNNTSPLGEISITNERSKKGALGFYGRHFSNNGNFRNDSKQKIYAGFMDNDLSLFGKKFYREGVIGGSVSFKQRTRHAYGFIPEEVFVLNRKDTKLNYGNAGVNLSVESAKLDSSSFAYDFDLRYNYFYSSSALPSSLNLQTEQYHHNFGVSGLMSRSIRGFYAGSGIDFEYYNLPPSLSGQSKYIASLHPFLAKTSAQWYFRLGFQALVQRNLERTASLHLYPDVHFGFNIVPSYINFFTSLTGKLEKNDPQNVVEENPFLLPGGYVFNAPNTDHQLIVSAGLKGNNGINSTYELSASYSLIEDMLFYSNLFSTDSLTGRGNFFMPMNDDVDLLRVHGAMNGTITEKLSFNAALNFYRYTMTTIAEPYNKPGWDASLGLKYNLRDKILAGIELTGIGKRKQIVTEFAQPPDFILRTVDMPVHVNLNLMAEYRYSRILSFWARMNEISYRRYFEWAYYPSHMFQFMIGFTYSL